MVDLIQRSLRFSDELRLKGWTPRSLRRTKSFTRARMVLGCPCLLWRERWANMMIDWCIDWVTDWKSISWLLQDLVLSGTSPTLMYGYGGFSSNLDPFFSVGFLAFVSMFDGILAFPNIRGGGWVKTLFETVCFEDGHKIMPGFPLQWIRHKMVGWRKIVKQTKRVWWLCCRSRILD